ncbi:MAG: hypothetical protein ACI9KE_005808 [Polyangiales bacterium]|jgi:hypothetical protein
MQGNNEQAPGQPPHDPARFGRLSVRTSHNPFAWMLFFVSTSVEINGHAQKQPWGTSTYDLPEGVHNVKVYFNYLFGPAGVGMTQVQIYAGHNSHLSYRPPIFIFSTTNIVENERHPIHQLPAG